MAHEPSPDTLPDADLLAAGLAQPGQLIAGKYLVERPIGEGGMGVVLLAKHTELGERIALKMLRAGPARDREQSVLRFRREARAAARLKGHHVARALDSGTHEGIPFIVFELIVGESLAALLKSQGPRPLAEVARCALEICEALAEAHALGIIHRDLKPSNLMLTTGPDGSPTLKVLDFGIARQDDEELATLTRTSSTLGSPRYMSPEQIRTPHEVDARSDIWSLGVTLYELLTGQLPFLASTVPALFVSISVDEPVPPRRACPELPAELETLLLRCLRKSPDERFSSVEELAMALAPFAPEGQATAARVGRIYRRGLARERSEEPPAPAPATAATGDETAPPSTLFGAPRPPISVTAEIIRPLILADPPAPLAPPARPAPWRAVGAGALGLAVVGLLVSFSRAPAAGEPVTHPGASPLPASPASAATGPASSATATTGATVTGASGTASTPGTTGTPGASGTSSTAGTTTAASAASLGSAQAAPAASVGRARGGRAAGATATPPVTSPPPPKPAVGGADGPDFGPRK